MLPTPDVFTAANSRKGILAYFVLIALLALLFFFLFLPQVDAQYRQQRDHAMQITIDVESSFFSRLIDDRLNALRALAESPVIINSVMLADENNFELIGLLEGFQLVGDPARIIIQDLSGGTIYQAGPRMLEIDPANNDWVEDLKQQRIASRFQLLNVKNDTFNFMLAIPVLYGEHVEGLLFANVSAPISKLFRQPSQNDFQFVISQGKVSATLYSASVEAPYSISKVIDPYDITLTYTASRLSEQQFLAQIRKTGLVVLFAVLVFSLMVTIYFSKQSILGGETRSAGLPTEDSHASRYSLTSYLLPLVILAFGLASSYVGYQLVVQLGQKNTKDEVIAAAKRQALKIEDSINSNIATLRALKSFYDSSTSVTRQEFKRFAAPLLENGSDIQAVEWIPAVPHALRRQYESNARAEGNDRFRIVENEGDKLVAATRRELYYPVYYVEPLRGNESRLGYDLGSSPAQLQALSHSGASGELTASAGITLVQQNKPQTGFLLVAPVYNKSDSGRSTNTVEGFVLVVLRIADMVAASLRGSDAEARVTIHDVTSNSEPGALLYTSAGETADSVTASTLYSKAFDIGGRRWLMSLAKTKLLTAKTDWTALLVLALGAVFSLFAAFYILQLSRRGEQIERVVVRRTEEITELTTAMENAVEGVSRLDDQGIYTYVNESYAGNCGYRPEELVGNAWPMTVHEDDHEAMNAAYQTMLRDGRISAEAVGVRKDGSHFHKALTMVSRYDSVGEFVGHYCFMSDISSRKCAEEKLLNSNIELERFAYIASHDLQEPLRMVSNFAELLADEYAENFDDTARIYFHYITDGAQRMRQLVEDLLIYAKVDHNAEEYCLTDCVRECEIVINHLADMIEATNAAVTLAELPTVYASPVRINRLLQNLISNAIKYASPDRSPTIHIDFEESHDEWVFSVADNGIGMKEEYLEQIFVIFKRLHNSRELQGTGIGLAICKKVVDSFSGRIWAKSEFGKGSTIYFSIPKNAVSDNLELAVSARQHTNF